MTEVAAELAARRHKVYGLRIADDPTNVATFAVVCPQHKVVGYRLTLVQARVVLSEHEGLHETA